MTVRVAKAASKAQPAPSKPKPAQGLDATQKARFARSLVGADLIQAHKAAVALQTRAAAERGTKPADAAHLETVAHDRLALIDAEHQARGKLAAKLSNGETGAQYEAALKSKSAAQLASLKKSLAGSKAADAPLRRLAVNRELDRRQAAADARAAGQERARLDGVKSRLGKLLATETPAQINATYNAENVALGQAIRQAASARSQVNHATSPAQKSAAQTALASAEKHLRTEYARQAVLAQKLPPQWDHQALHAYANTLKSKSLRQLETERIAVDAAYHRLASGAVRGTALELGTAKVKIAIVDAAIAKAQKPAAPKNLDPTRNPGNKVFDGPGMFVANASAYPAGLYAAKLKAAGVTWVALQIHNPGPVDGNVASLQQGWADAWRAAGFKVGFWGVSYGNAATDGKTAADLTAQYKGDFYIADCEGAFQAGQGDPAHNAEFVNAFQSEADARGIGQIPRALSSMGRVALDMQPWIKDGWDAMPQAYWNSYSVYQPSLCVKFYEDTGWPKDRIHPTIASYTGEGENLGKQVGDYVADLKTAGTTGFSYYLPESYLDDSEYQQLVAGVQAGMNGPPEPAGQ